MLTRNLTEMEALFRTHGEDIDNFTDYILGVKEVIKINAYSKETMMRCILDKMNNGYEILDDYRKYPIKDPICEEKSNVFVQLMILRHPREYMRS